MPTPLRFHRLQQSDCRLCSTTHHPSREVSHQRWYRLPWEFPQLARFRPLLARHLHEVSNSTRTMTHHSPPKPNHFLPTHPMSLRASAYPPRRLALPRSGRPHSLVQRFLGYLRSRAAFRRNRGLVWRHSCHCIRSDPNKQESLRLVRHTGTASTGDVALRTWRRSLTHVQASPQRALRRFMLCDRRKAASSALTASWFQPS